jgi:tRNA(Ile)-lysidine synthase
MVFLSENNLPYVADSTNSNEDYTRNYIRHSLLPAFEKVNSNYSAAIKRLSQSASTDEDYFSKELDKITSETKLDSLHPAISSRYICKEYEKLSGGEGLGAVHVRQILSCLSSEEEKRMDLPFGIKAFVKNGKVIFIGKEINSPISAKEVFFLSEGVNVFCGNVRVFIENVPSDSKGESESESKKIQRFSDSPLQIVIDRDKIKGELYARRRSDGDKLKTRGINRAVSKELMNAKVPKHTRAFIPVICDADGIVFVPFVGAEARVFTKGHAEHPVRIKVEIDS